MGRGRPGYTTTAVASVKFCAAHRVVGLGKCENIHGHNFSVSFAAFSNTQLDGGFIDFRTIKGRMRDWLDKFWDHGLIYQRNDVAVEAMLAAADDNDSPMKSFALNEPPTCEALAAYLYEVVLPELFDDTTARFQWIELRETDSNVARIDIGEANSKWVGDERWSDAQRQAKLTVGGDELPDVAEGSA